MPTFGQMPPSRRRVRVRAIALAMLAAGLPHALTGNAYGQVVGETLGPALVRWHASAAAQRTAGRSWSVEILPPVKVPIPAGAEPPTFSTLEPAAPGQAPTAVAFICVMPGTTLYGLGPTSGPLDRAGVTPSVALETGFILAINADGSALGVLADTPRPVVASLASGIEFRVTGAPLPIITISGPDAAAVLTRLHEVIGRTELAPRWSMGLSVRAGGTPDAVRGTLAALRERSIRASALWLDRAPSIPARDWPGTSFTDWPELQREIRAAGLAIVASSSPTIPASPSSDVLDAAKGGEHLVLTTTGALASADDAGVTTHWLDATRSRSRSWWAGRIAQSLALGADGAILDTDPVPPAGSRFRADLDLGGLANTPAFDSTYRTLVARATFAGAGTENTLRRPFVASRSYALTAARSGAILTGSRDDTPPAFLRRAISASISGLPLLAADLSTGLASPDPAFRRAWLSAVALMPVLVSDVPAGGDPAADVGRVLAWRERLTPAIYTAFFVHLLRCDPVIRPVAFIDPRDQSLRAIDSAFLLGTDLLVVPRLTGTSADQESESQLLARSALAGWRRLPLSAPDDPVLPAVYLRPGAVIPTTLDGEIYAKDLKKLQLFANLPEPSADGTSIASGNLFEDDGIAYGFATNQCRTSSYEVRRQGDQAFARVVAMSGGWPMPQRPVRIEILSSAGSFSGTGNERGTIRVLLRTPQGAP